MNVRATQLLDRTPEPESTHAGNRSTGAVTVARPAGVPRPARPSVSIVIPTLNEAENLPHVLPRIPAWVSEVILVDGSSTDGTIDVARKLLPGVRVVLESRRGKGFALRRGFAAASGDIIVMMDADGSTNPEEIGAFVRHLRDGADFVKGSRYLQGAGSVDITPFRALGNHGLTHTVRLLFGSRYTDLCYGFCAFWSDVLPQLNLDAEGFEIEAMMNIRALKARLRIVEVHSTELQRIHGTSNLSAFRDGWRILRTIVRERIMPTVRRIDGTVPSLPASNKEALLTSQAPAGTTGGSLITREG